MTSRPLRPLLALAAIATAVSVGAPMSGAVYTSAGVNPGNALRAAQDWVGPVVAVTNPGTPLRGTVNVAATAADSPSGVASVRLQRSPAGAGSWVDICTDTTSPYACPWTTSSVADGRYDLRAVATDLAGNVSTSAVVADRLVDNTAPTAVLVDPGSAVRGTVTLTTTSTDAGSGIASVRYERAPSETTTWTTICAVTASPFSCVFSTTAVANGDYDLRITVTDLAGNTSTDVVEVEIDNTAPAVTMTNPGSPIAGVITLGATATDADSGVATVTIQRSPAGSGSWATVCVSDTFPFGCRFDTTTVADGLHDFRAIAVDAAGNTTTSVVVTNRRVDNTISTVSVDDPGAYLRGTVTVTANASSTGGVASVRIQRARTGTTTWIDLCTDTTAPYSCPFDTTTAATPDGGYDFRAIMTTTAGATFTSATVANRIVDNSPVRAHDVDAINRAGGTLGRMEAGDALLLTYTDLMRPATLIAGWSGTGSAAVFVRVRDGALVGGASSADVLQFSTDQSGANAAGLGTVNLKTDTIKSGKTSVFAATATLSTVTVDGRDASQVTLVVGTQVSGGGLKARTTPTAMTWSPAVSALDLAGRPVSPSPATESGDLDANF